MKVVYIAGPFRSMNKGGRPNAWGIHKNVVRAMETALLVWQNGGAALCPHANTMFYDGANGIVDEVWLDGDLELLRRCDAVLCTENWKLSTGATNEVLHALRAGMPVFGPWGYGWDRITDPRDGAEYEIRPCQDLFDFLASGAKYALHPSTPR